ncbi:hypothetical protein BHU72_13050 [Desulfuribacillus stibiiarsenatis]|uniref:Uncharacterized protein n=1 Tax=Desulfuribacillus stibiiarsenatis TaxID=1390249 RepID=A0A1E5L8Q1_9FIRM|nr:hypothetical protein BHU72_13050 [Desulfuribacillus stibiiarsenatis]
MSKTIKIAVIGAGHWGQNYVKVLNELDVLTALADPQEEIRTKFSKQYPNIKIVADYKQLLVSPEIDGVIVATPAATHHQVTMDALRAGKDVLVEKPMALSVHESIEMHEMAIQSNRILMVGHLLLYKPAVQKILQLVQNKVIGELCYIKMQRTKLGKVRDQENVIWSFAPHDLAVILALVDSTVEEVSVKGQCVIQPEIEDDAYMHIDFANKVKAHIHVSWLWPEDIRKTTIVGTTGMMIYNEKENKLEIHRKIVDNKLSCENGEVKEIDFETVNILNQEVMHFLDCMKHRKIPITSSQSGIDVIKVLEKATQALDKTKRQNKYFVHDSATIELPTKIGDGTQIWRNCHIMPGVQIGNACKFGQNVFVASNVKIGNNVKIQNNVSVYEGVILEDNVFCGPSMVFTNVKTPRSQFIRNTSSDYAITLVKEGASIGANATIVCGIQIGKHALIGAGSVVTKDVPNHAIIYGNPGKIQGWICKCGETIIKKTDKILKCDTCSTEITTDL